MVIVVTGGAGFIGSHIVDAAVSRGDKVVVIDNFATGKMENVNPSAVLCRMDIRDKEVDGVFAEHHPDAVIHEAAQVNLRYSVDDPVYDADVNILGTINLLQSCIRHGVKKFVFASSGGAVYGEQEVFPAPDGHPTRPMSPYGIAKLTIEHYLYYYSITYGLDYTALRYSNVYGPRQDPYGEAGVVAIFAEKMLKGETPVINGDGGQTRDYVYVGDVVRANMLALDGSYTGTLNAGTGVEASVNELFDTLKSETGFKGERVHGPAKLGEQRRSVIDHSLFREKLGWDPTVSLEEGLKHTVEFFRGKRA